MTFKFTRLESTAAPLLEPDINTDIILPARFLKRITAEGLGQVLFNEWRFDDQGKPKPSFVLNQPAYRQARILIAGNNFGCGSSRENAVWALYDYGIRCVIAPSFGDIFYNNCLNYGLLPIRLDGADLQQLALAVTQSPDTLVEADLETQQLRWGGHAAVPITIAEHSRQRLLRGLDEISLTLAEHEPDIAAYENRRTQQLPWLFKDIGGHLTQQAGQATPPHETH